MNDPKKIIGTCLSMKVVGEDGKEIEVKAVLHKSEMAFLCDGCHFHKNEKCDLMNYDGYHHHLRGLCKEAIWEKI